MNKYAYRVYKNGNLANPIYGGTVSSNTMDNAVKNVIQRHKITARHEQGRAYTDHYFMLDGVKVGILIYTNPEEY